MEHIYLLTTVKICIRLSAKFITLKLYCERFSLIGSVRPGLLKIKYAMRDFFYMQIDCCIAAAILIERFRFSLLLYTTTSSLPMIRSSTFLYIQLATHYLFTKSH